MICTCNGQHEKCRIIEDLKAEVSRLRKIITNCVRCWEQGQGLIPSEAAEIAKQVALSGSAPEAPHISSEHLPGSSEHLANSTPDYYYRGGSTTYTDEDPEVTCPHCRRTFRTDAMDAACRLCGEWFQKRKSITEVKPKES